MNRQSIRAPASAVADAKDNYEHLLRPRIEQWELSPSCRCTLDCVGCPDRLSLHRQDPPEKTQPLAWWISKLEEIQAQGGTYALLIGGELTTAFPGLSDLLAHVAGMPTLDVGLSTDGVALINRKTGGASRRLQQLIERGRLLEVTTHISAEYFFETPDGEALPDLEHRRENPRRYKSSYGIRLARMLVEMGAKRVVLNSVMKPDTLSEVIPVYEYCARLQEMGDTVVLQTVSPWQHRPHLCRGDDPGNFPPDQRLTPRHREEVDRIARYLLDDTWARIRSGRPRVAANSSGYLEALSTSGILQNVGCHMEPGMRGVAPDGSTRLCPVMTTMEQVLTCWGCSYGGITDRVLENNRWTPRTNGGEDVEYFTNLIQSTLGDYEWR